MNSVTQTIPADDATLLAVDEPGPAADDEAWAMATFNAEPTVSATPLNGQPTTLAHFVDDEARSYRSQGTPQGAFIADHLERLSQLIRWTGGTTPAEHEDRMAFWDEEIRAKEFDRGYAEGVEATRRELAIYLPR